MMCGTDTPVCAGRTQRSADVASAVVGRLARRPSVIGRDAQSLRTRRPRSSFRHSGHRRARSLPGMTPRSYHEIRKLSREQLKVFVAENIKHLGEDEAIAVIE